MVCNLVSVYFNSPQIGIHWKQTVWIFWSSFRNSFSATFCALWFFKKNVSNVDQISLSYCIYFLRYWIMCVLQLLGYQVVASWPKRIWSRSEDKYPWIFHILNPPCLVFFWNSPKCRGLAFFFSFDFGWYFIHLGFIR